MCGLDTPTGDPVLSLLAMSAGSSSLSGLVLPGDAGSEPDVRLPPPALGDEANRFRAWGAAGCREALAVRSGTLALSARVRLAPGPAKADCGSAAPAGYLEAVLGRLLDGLAPGRAGAHRGRPRPPRGGGAAHRGGKAQAGRGHRHAAQGPRDLSEQGRVGVRHRGDEWAIVFFEADGILGHYTGWVHSSSGDLSG